MDVWVNNAGVLLTGPAWEQTDEQGPLAVWRTHDASGHVLEGAIAEFAQQERAGVEVGKRVGAQRAAPV